MKTNTNIPLIMFLHFVLLNDALTLLLNTVKASTVQPKFTDPSLWAVIPPEGFRVSPTDDSLLDDPEDTAFVATIA